MNTSPLFLFLVISLGILGGWKIYDLLRGLVRRRLLAAASRALRARLTDTMIDTYGIVEVYRDELGRVWYGFVNPARMPANRAIYVEIATRQAGLNMTDATLRGFLGKMEESMNKGKFTEVAGILEEMKGRLTWACEEESLLALSTYYFVLEGEDPTVVTDDWIRKKKEYIITNEKARAFFLTASFRATRELSDISETDILAYLAERKVRESILGRSTSIRTSRSTSTG